MLYTHDGGNDDIYKKRLIKTETFWKNSCFKEILQNFSFPVNMCVYIGKEYWPEHSFIRRLIKSLELITRFLLNFENDIKLFRK